MSASNEKYRKWINIWLFAGVVMVLVQIMLGGITRLTGSGLSITRWEIVTGTIPPLNQRDWNEAFLMYQSTPQYKMINEGMTLAQFKFIFFWEYIHRLWARSMGFVFLFPFLFFLFKRALRRETIRRLMVVVFLAALAAIFGWVMVASGLVKRPWVNAYKLTIHLGLGICLFLFLIYTWWRELNIKPVRMEGRTGKLLTILIILVIIQICLGGLVSGMKAALNYPTWPTMNNEWIPAILFDTSHWNMNAVLLYDQSGFMPAWVQFKHRLVAYISFILVIWFYISQRRISDQKLNQLSIVLLGIVFVQVLLGILTLLGSKGSIPVFTGAFHQVTGILLLTLLIYMRYCSKLKLMKT